jgi:hypothetical protein
LIALLAMLNCHAQLRTPRNDIKAGFSLRHCERPTGAWQSMGITKKMSIFSFALKKLVIPN